MLLTRDEMAFDFKGAKFDRVRDRDLLAWIASQFLYGEVTGVQVGHWIRRAPDVESARFLARQCVEELQHVDVFKEFFRWLDARPVPVHPVVKMLSGESSNWEEHVALEMAQGEGFVLMIFYALLATLDDEKMVKRLEAAVRQEEGHVEFGEEQTQRLIARDPRARKRLLGLHLLSLWAIRRFEKWIRKRVDMSHAVMRLMPDYLKRILEVTELRLMRVGILDKPLAQMGRMAKFGAIVRALVGRFGRKLAFWRWFNRKTDLTNTYMADPYLADVMALKAGNPWKLQG
ncbi:MAG: ferritin-like domain-containing protein [Planctomycetes bacterium]|nr:ferritin-like domain-containing protein [Planctomycetota bacterium]